MASSEFERLLTPSQLADAWGISYSRVLRYIKDGSLPAFVPKGRTRGWLVRESDALAFQQQ